VRAMPRMIFSLHSLSIQKAFHTLMSILLILCKYSLHSNYCKNTDLHERHYTPVIKRSISKRLILRVVVLGNSS
jgi:hypothetical protein